MTRHRSTYEYPPFALHTEDDRFCFRVSKAPPKGLFGVLFQSVRYAYVLTEQERGYRDGIEVERWRAEHTGACPWVGWLHEDGTTAVLHADDELVCFRADGTKKSRCNVLELLQRDPLAIEHCVDSTAGQFWTSYPLGYFVKSARGLRLCVRTPFLVRLVIDPERGVLDPAASTELLEEESVWMLRSLEQVVQTKDAPKAALLALCAGQDRLLEAEPYLRALEKEEWSPERWTSGPKEVLAYSSVRVFAQTALVRLGVKFEPSNAYGPRTVSRPAAWQKALESLKEGMLWADVVQRAGAPFFLGFNEQGVLSEYDVWKDGEYETLRLQWKRDKLVKIERAGRAFEDNARDALGVHG